MTHEDGVGGSFKYEVDEVSYAVDETQSPKQNDIPINDILDEIKAKLSILNHFNHSIEKLLAKFDK